MNNSHMINGNSNNIVDTLSYESEALDNSQIYKSRPGILQKLNSRYKGLKMGFRSVSSSPLTRSSMDAGEMFEGSEC